MHLFSTLAGTPRRKMWLVHHVVVSELQPRCPFCRESVFLNFFWDCQWDPSTRNLILANWAGSRFNVYWCKPHPWSNTTFFSFLKLILRLFKNLKNILRLSAFNSKVKPNVTLYWHSQPMLKMPSVYKWWLSKFFSQWSSLSMLLLILYCFGNLMSGWWVSFITMISIMVTKLKPKRLFMEINDMILAFIAAF